MNPVRISLAVVGATVALVASACGGGGANVPAGSIAVVSGTDVSKADLDQLLAQVKNGYAANKQQFPKAGTPEYQSLQTQYVAYLVQREEFRQAGADLGVEVSKKDVDKAEADLVTSKFGGDKKEYEKALKQQGLTSADYRTILETSVLAQKIFDKVTKDTTVTDQDVLAYYTQNQSQYGATSESRDVRHILISEKDAKGQVDFAKSKVKADQIYAQLEGGASFAKLAKKNSADSGTKDLGGKLTISRGHTVPAFDKVAFDLKENEISKPVKTLYGYHIIEAISPVRPPKSTLDQVKESIRTTLLQQKKQETMTAWVADLRKKYDGKVTYAAGYEPPAIPEATTTTQ
jgi:foldase protein PrsA